MTDLNHDTFAVLELGTPIVFVAAAIALPIGLTVQFLLAGQALFGALAWLPHVALGGAIGLLVVPLVGYSWAMRRLRGFAWWASMILVLYLVQVALGGSGPVALTFHPFNAALLLITSLVMVLKVERRNREYRHRFK